MFGTWGESHTGKGILEINNNLECPICFENKLGISQPNCEHTLCIGCFKRCHYGEYNEEIEENEIKENLRKCPLCRK